MAKDKDNGKPTQSNDKPEVEINPDPKLVSHTQEDIKPDPKLKSVLPFEESEEE